MNEAKVEKARNEATQAASHLRAMRSRLVVNRGPSAADLARELIQTSTQLADATKALAEALLEK